MPGLVRMAACGPALQAPPHEAVKLGQALTTEDMAMVIRPAAEEGVEGSDELLWSSTRGLFAAGADLGREGLEAGRAGVIRSLAGFLLRRSCLRKGCPQKSQPCAIGVMTVFSADSRMPRAAKKALIRGRTTSAKTSRELAVTMKSSAHLT